MKLKLFACFFLCIISLVSALADDPTITVTKALWGGKDVTAEAKSHCDDVFSCDYKVSTNYIGEAKNPLKKSFSIRWTCTGKPTVHTHTVPHDATDVQFTIDCEKALISKGHTTLEFPAKGLPKRSGLAYAHSYKKMVLSKTPNVFQESIGSTCLGALRKLYAAGKSLASRNIKKHMVSSQNYINLDSKTDFYHYTEAQELANITKYNRPLDIFEYIRMKKSSKDFSTWLSAFYVADDTESSSHYGNILVKVFMRKNITILSEMDYDIANNDGGLNKIVGNELVTRYPTLKSCQIQMKTDSDGKSYNAAEATVLYFLSAEEMGVDMIHYKWSVGDGHWFQVLNPYAIDHLSN